MIGLVAFDLDGTVLSTLNQASLVSVKTIQKLVEKGIWIASVSGRNMENSQAPFSALPDLASAMFIGCYNGAVVLDLAVDGQRRILWEERVPELEFQEIMEYIGFKQLNFVYCKCDVREKGIKEAYITDRETESVQKLELMTGVRVVFDEDLLPRIGKGEFSRPPKLIVMSGKDSRDSTFEEMQEIFGGRLYLARTGEDRIEIMHKKSNKGMALRVIALACEVPLEEVLAVGDGDNDLPMLQEAGLGVLVESSDEVTLKVAQETGVRIGPTFEAEGFSDAVHRYVLDV